MKTDGLKSVVLASLIILGADTLRAQPTASPASFNFTNQVGSTALPAAGKLTATLSKSTATGYTLAASTASVSPPEGWLTVTPRSGASPLALTVTVNVTGLSPGSYTGFVALGTTPPTNTTELAPCAFAQFFAQSIDESRPLRKVRTHTTSTIGSNFAAGCGSTE